MTPTEVLTAARALIADPDHWCQDSIARTASDDPAEARSDLAVKWSMQGALARCSVGSSAYVAYGLLVAQTRGARTLPFFNDSHSHGEVLAAFDRAIEVTT